MNLYKLPKFPLRGLGGSLFTLCMLMACSDNAILPENLHSEIPGQDTPFAITADGGSELNIPHAAYGEYMGRVNVSGAWRITTSQAGVAVFPSEGTGPADVLVQVGENWGTARLSELTLDYQHTGTRAADGEASYTTRIRQSAYPELDSISRIFSSNKGAGYSYYPNDDFFKGVVMPLFNLNTLDSLQRSHDVTYIIDDLFPSSDQLVITSDTEEGLTRKLGVQASLGVDYKNVSVKLGGGYNSSTDSKTSRKYALKRLKAYQFTREIHYMNIMEYASRSDENARRVFSPGFLYLQNKLAADLKKAATQEEKEMACNDFMQACGPCFVSKAAMGNTLDFVISVDSTQLSKDRTITAALDLAVKSKVSVNAKFEMTDSEKQLFSQTETKLAVRGGDVSLVSILVTGGSLSDQQVATWQMSCRPRQAVLGDMNLLPIHYLIIDEESRRLMQNYLTKLLTEK